MPAVLIDVGYHLVEPDTSEQTVVLTVTSTGASDAAVAGFDLRAQIVTAKQGPYFQSVRFAGDLWNTFPHVESGGPFPANRTLATGDVAFTQGLQAKADGTLVTFTIDTTGIPAGSYEFRLIGTQLGSSSFRRSDGSSVSEVITNGTLHVRSIWQNADNPNDINDDGRITPLDVLLLLNELSKGGSRELPMPSPGEEPPPYYDVNGDGYISPLDPLGAINCLNGLSCVTSPGRILAQVTPDFPPPGPGSTGTGKSDPEDPIPGEVPPGEGDPGEPEDCFTSLLDEDGNPIPIDPDFCDDFGLGDPNPPHVGPVAPDDTLTPVNLFAPANTVTLGPLGNSAKDLSATAVPSTSVDAVIADLADELEGEEESEELVDIGLDLLFAIS